MSKVIAFANHKGGVAKTTSTASIGGYLAREGYRVLMVDLDGQANLTLMYLEDDDERPTIYDAMVDGKPLPVLNVRENLDIVPSGIEMASAEIALVNKLERERVLSRVLSPVKNKYDFVLIDCPPALNNVTTNAFLAADHILVPMTAELLPLKGMRMLDAYIEQLKQVKPSLGITGVFFTRYKARHNLAKAGEEAVSEVYGDVLLKTKIRENTSMAESAGSGNDIFDYASRSAAAEDYRELTKEILNKLK